MIKREGFQAGYAAAIKKIVPPDLLTKAGEIVQAHKPTNPALANFDPQMALTPDEHGELNVPGHLWTGGRDEKKRRIDELREIYSGDSVALEQIDGYDPKSNSSKELKKFLDGLESGSTK